MLRLVIRLKWRMGLVDDRHDRERVEGRYTLVYVKQKVAVVEVLPLLTRSSSVVFYKKVCNCLYDVHSCPFLSIHVMLSGVLDRSFY
jgi:hypothetical protein